MPVTRKFQPADAGVSRAVIGTRGNDEIIGTDRRDRMIGEDGDDRLFGRDGDDLLIGGSGNDYLDGGEGMDRLVGNDGADTFVFRELQSRDLDRVSDFKSADGDKIDLSVISGHMIRAGLDPLHFSGQNPASYAVWYRPGVYDRGHGSRLAVDVNGDAVPDITVRLHGVLSLSAQDLILAGPEEPVADRVLKGTEHSDLLHAGPGRDYIDGHGNDDAVDYRDTLLPVNVTLAGEQPTTVFVDDVENDVIVNIEHAFGGFGDDWLAGDDGNNILSGRAGADILVGGLGADTLTGGLGPDRFLYLDPSETHGDLIVDFSRAQGDVVDISALDANVLVPGQQEFVFSGQAPKVNSVWYRMFIEGKDVLHVQGDIDGDATTPEVDITIEGLSSISARDLNLFAAISGDAVDFSGSNRPAVVNLGDPIFQGLSSVVGARGVWNTIHSEGSVKGTFIGGDKGNNITGSDSDEMLRGGRGDDSLHGGGGRDILKGGAGDDFLEGGTGADTLTGGLGLDQFHYQSADEARGDIITDFSRTQGDWLDLYRIDANAGKDHWQVFSFNGAEARPHALWYGPDPDGAGTRLYGDTDGDVETTEIDILLQGIETVEASDLPLPVDRGQMLDFSDLIRYSSVGMSTHHPFLDVIGPKEIPANLWGEEGSNLLIGGGKSDYITGGSGNDTLYGMEGEDQIFGGAGDDRLDGGTGNDTINGGDGADNLTGGRGADRFLYGRAEETTGDVVTDFDVLEGDWIDLTQVDAGGSSRGEPGFWQGFVFSGTKPAAHALWYRFDKERRGTELSGDTDGNPDTAEVSIYLKGTEYFGQEALQLPSFTTDKVDFSATTRHPYIDLDRYDGLNNAQGPLGVAAELHGNRHANTLSGGRESDALSGYDGDDTLAGGAGDDALYGGRGDDALYGDDGNDLLEGGPGADVLIGGDGSDRFRYTKAADAVDDVIMDFNREQGDWIDLHQVDANVYDSSWQILSFNGAKAARHSLWYKLGEDGEGVILCGDTDGNIRTREITIEVKGVTALLASDFDMPVLSPDTPDISTTLQALRGILVPDFPDMALRGFRLYGDADDEAGLELPAMQAPIPVDLDYVSKGYSYGDDGVSGPAQDDDGDADPLVPGTVFGEDPYSARSSISGYTSHQFSNFLLRVLNEEDRFSSLHGQDTDRLTGPETLDFSATSNYRLIDVAMYRGVNNVVGPQASGTEIRGDNGPNVLTGGDGPDVIHGEAGDDILVGGLGNDIMYGGSGNDILTGEEGKDTLYGDDGNDILTGGTGADTMYGGRGHDTLTGDAGNDVLEGGEGSDTLSGGAGADVLRGGEGRDTLSGGLGADRFHYMSAAETIDDTIADFSRVQGDWIDLHGIDSGSNPDVWQGFVFHGTTARPNALWYQVDGNGRGLHLYGDTDGNVTSHEIAIAVRGITVMEARDLPLPTFTMDTVDFSSVRNYTTVNLSDYREIPNIIGSRMVGMELYGTGADNTLTGGDGDDSLYGAGGNDVLAGGDGKDVLTGGSGADTFLFWSVAGTVGDVITDFSRTQGDKLDFNLIDADSVAEGIQDLGFTGTTPQAYSVWYTPNAAATDVILCGDTDGHADTTEIAFLLKGVSSLSETDFLF